jgi:HK97 family phage prohead protease
MSAYRLPIRRSFVADLEAGDGRTLYGRCVPYNEVARVADDNHEPYLESFAPGAFRRNTRAAHRVLLDFEHSPHMIDKFGRATELVERDDGLYGTFKVFDCATGDHALSLVNEGVLRGMSIGAVVLGPGRRGARGEIIRTNCHLDSVALVRKAAYDSAEVLALRDNDDLEPVDLAELRPPTNTELNDRLRALGIGS